MSAEHSVKLDGVLEHFLQAIHTALPLELTLPPLSIQLNIHPPHDVGSWDVIKFATDVENIVGGFDADIKNVFSNVREKKWNRSKVMLVGERRAGKTCLANALMNNPFSNTASTRGAEQFTMLVPEVEQFAVDPVDAVISKTGWISNERTLSK
jgi:tRNA U34 5-carboxymethylaminomethyl modifying GTPase MnmE/TrmE